MPIVRWGDVRVARSRWETLTDQMQGLDSDREFEAFLKIKNGERYTPRFTPDGGWHYDIPEVTAARIRLMNSPHWKALFKALRIANE